MMCKRSTTRRSSLLNEIISLRSRETLLAITVVLGTSCSLAPVTPRLEASSVGAGNFRIGTVVAPVVSFSGAYGLTKNLDIGIDAEQFDTLSGWTRYSMINNNEGFSLAVTSGIFKKHNFNNADGYFIGSVLSNKLNDRIVFTSGYRYSRVFYDPVDHNNINLSDDVLWESVDSRSSDDLAKTSQLHLSLSYQFYSNLQFNLGALCQHHHANNDPEITKTNCGPLLGLSFKSN